MSSGRHSAVTRSRWRWRVLWHRPRLLRFWVWRVERFTTQERTPELKRTTIVSIGQRASSTPLLLLGFSRGLHAPRSFSVEWTFYPSQDRPRHAPRPLVSLHPTIQVGRVRLWSFVSVWPGFQYVFLVGSSREPRW